MERREIGIPQCLIGNFRINVVTTGLGRAISHEMFKACGNAALRGQIIALIALNGSLAEH